MKKYKFEEISVSVKISSPSSKADFSEKCLLGIWRLILSRYNIKLNIYRIILNV